MTEIIETKEQRVLHVEIKPNVDTPARSFDLALPFFGKAKNSFIRITEDSKVTTIDFEGDDGVSVYQWCDAETACVEDFEPVEFTDWIEAKYRAAAICMHQSNR
jgi:hypothetical protein